MFTGKVDVEKYMYFAFDLAEENDRKLLDR